MAIEVQCESTGPLRAAQYLRMSTEHQQYSIANQSTAISLYAAAHQLVIVKSYIDSGKSGLNIKGRPALRELIQEVSSGRAEFQCILTYDVSRWGRFQDIDEAAHYEFLCRSAGINIHYCAEQFQNNNNLFNSLLKSLKRMMAGEYSRELSVKVSAGKLRFAKMGFSQGGNPPYGLRRFLFDNNGNPRQVLARREQKAVSTDRVIYVLGPPQEIAVVHKIFDLCTVDHKWPKEIASELNKAGIRSPSGKLWIGETIQYMLNNPKYMGEYVYARRTQTLSSRLVRNQPERWARKKDAFDAIISPAQFDEAQHFLATLHPTYTDEELLNILRGLLKKNGKLSWSVLKQSKSGPGPFIYGKRFGGLEKAYAAIGYEPEYNYARVNKLRRSLQQAEWGLRNKLVELLKARGIDVCDHAESRGLTLNGEVNVGIRATHYKYWNQKWLGFGWDLRISFKKDIQILIVACLGSGEDGIHAQYIIPKLSLLEGRYWSREGNERVFLEAFRSHTLQPLIDAVKRSSIQVADG